jgi:hypothetical protein
MKRKPVESSALRSVGYDEENQILEVEILETGRVYQYQNVPINEYIAFIQAPSIGWYYNKMIKERYEYFEK